MTASMTSEELESPVANQTSNSAHRDYHRESQQRGYCRDPTRTEVERWLKESLQDKFVDTPDKRTLREIDQIVLIL